MGVLGIVVSLALGCWADVVQVGEVRLEGVIANRVGERWYVADPATGKVGVYEAGKVKVALSEDREALRAAWRARVERVDEEVVQVREEARVEQEVRTIRGDAGAWAAWRDRQARGQLEWDEWARAVLRVKREAEDAARQKTEEQDSNFMEPPGRRYTLSFSEEHKRLIGEAGIRWIQQQSLNEQRAESRRLVQSVRAAGLPDAMARIH